MPAAISRHARRPPTAMSRRNPPASRAWALAQGAVLIALAALLGACIVEREMGASLENDLGEPVDIVYLVDPEVIVGHLGTDDSTTASRDNQDTFDDVDFGMERAPRWCTEADTVARAPDGRVLARIPPPLCDDSFTNLSAARGIVNDTSSDVTVHQVVDGREELLARLPPGDVSGQVFHRVAIGKYKTRCTDGDIVVRDDAGMELGRLPSPICNFGAVFVRSMPVAARLGQAVEIRNGEGSLLGTVTVLDVQRYTEVGTFTIDPGAIDPERRGLVWIAARVRYTAVAPFIYDEVDWDVRDEKADWYDADGITPDLQHLGGTLAAGQAVEGWVPFEVPAGVRRLWAFYTSGREKSRVVFFVNIYQADVPAP